MRTDVIDQTLAMALHPAYNCKKAMVSVCMMLNLTQSAETHTYIIRREVVEKLIEICELRHKMANERLLQTQQGEKEDPMEVNVLRYVTVILYPAYDVDKSYH